jgi:DNA-binding NarL/FixJ family response regulator
MTRDLIVSALRDVESLKKRLRAVLGGYNDSARGRKAARLKKENGRLTDAGVERVRIMIDAGRTDTEIARELEVTPAAVRPHRAKYSSEKVAPRRRRR